MTRKPNPAIKARRYDRPEPIPCDMPLKDRRYSVVLWDHDPADDGSEPGRWSAKLASRFLSKTTDLTWREIGQAIRILYSFGWSENSIYVEHINQLPQS